MRTPLTVNRMLPCMLMAVLVAAFALSGCARAWERASYPPEPSALPAADMMMDTAELSDSPARSVVAEGAPEQMPTFDRKLIRTAQLALVDLPDAAQTLEAVEKIAREAGGFVGSTSLRRDEGGTQSGSVTVRVPADRFDQALDKLRDLGKVRSVSTNVQDVTAEYVDLEARIRNAKRTEQEIIKLLDRGGKLADIITIETKLGEVRETIERYEGQMRVLREQVDLATITLHLSEKSEAAVPEAGKYEVAFHLRTAGRALAGLLQDILTIMIYFVLVGWVFWLPLVLLVWLVVRRNRARKAAQAPAETGGVS